MTPSIESLQARLLALTQERAQIQAPHVAMPLLDRTSIEKIVDERFEVLLKESAKAKSTVSPMAAIENFLNQEDKVWLSQTIVQDALAPFLSSSTGQDYIQLFITSFKEYYENKTCSSK